MNQLFAFIARQRAFILFVLLEVLSLWCYFKFNNYPSSIYFHTTNYYVARSLQLQASITNYLNLGEVNHALAVENARLNAEITFLKNKQVPQAVNYKADSAVASRFQPIVAKVVKNSVLVAQNNYLTLDKGTKDGVRPGMGVISPTGVVGIVKGCSEDFSLVTSLLHIDPPMRISSAVKRSGEIGSGRWEGDNTEKIKLYDISRYKSVKMGDTIVTSHFNSVFPAGIFVGFVKKLGISADQTFWDIDLKLATDFRNLSYVYILDNRLQSQQEQLESTLNPKTK
ncbi:rod shape-determining protein MreC [Siphonobacter aquaeclarae]|uniref:Cell shape-determining protein MreC n=1 Tax=Siphonobacter aquaeclarae TaxID=563176 RepID=A0A1G9M983_9BACT|nr:rod shape-determining protein MreC [Siphonobacter aquaeclarae]SDL70517.1 rod shape-determining protein MreC [Siphonobacter aquaeclarae]